MKQKTILLVLTISLFFGLLMQAKADSFTGKVMGATYYSFTVRNGTTYKIFQIREETKGNKFPRNGDQVLVVYKNEDGILVATFIKVLKPFTH